MSETYMDEQWKVSDDGRTATVTGRRRRDQKWSFGWFFQNDLEPEPPREYKPNDKYRRFKWYMRNPLQNFGRWVVGVCDRNYTVVGTAPVRLTAWNDIVGWDEPGFKHRGLLRGWKWSSIRLGWLRLPFVSYTGKYVMWYFGWQYWGFFGAKFNVLRSSVQIA